MTTPFSLRIKQLRKQKNITIAEIARKLKIAPSTYREWEQGRLIKGEPYMQLADIFEVSLSELITGDGGRESILSDLNKIDQIVKGIRNKL
jgi:transcriptional regulator with XRE-family HTH domain